MEATRTNEAILDTTNEHDASEHDASEAPQLPLSLRELSSLELSLVGGGSGHAIFA